MSWPPLTWQEQLEAAQRRMRATGGPTTPRHRPRAHKDVAQPTGREVGWALTPVPPPEPEPDVVGPLPGHRTRPTERDRRRTELRLAGPPTEDVA
jgi:hypothetical protein